MIHISPMTEEEYQAYLERAIREYAADKVLAGNWKEEEALERSREEYLRFLPQGIHTPGHFVNKLLNDEGETAGYLWYGRLNNHPQTAFIFDIEIYAPYRRRGYAQQALTELETLARAQKFEQIELHVFGHNSAARALYLKSGYIETNINMRKNL